MQEQEMMRFPLNGETVEIAWPFTPFGKALDEKVKELGFFLGAKCIRVGDDYNEYSRFYGFKKDSICNNFGIKYEKEFLLPLINIKGDIERFYDVINFVDPDYADKTTFVMRKDGEHLPYISNKSISELLSSDLGSETATIQIDDVLKIQFYRHNGFINVNDASISPEIRDSALDDIVVPLKSMASSRATQKPLPIKTFLDKTLPSIVKEITEKCEQHLDYY